MHYLGLCPGLDSGKWDGHPSNVGVPGFFSFCHNDYLIVCCNDFWANSIPISASMCPKSFKISKSCHVGDHSPRLASQTQHLKHPAHASQLHPARESCRDPSGGNPGIPSVTFFPFPFPSDITVKNGTQYRTTI